MSDCRRATVMFGARKTCAALGNRFRLHQTKQFCSSSKTNNAKKESNLSAYDESYRQLDNLDFPTAAKILFTDPPRKNKFGLDFHLVQLFFACMPSLAVYLVAQYARYEMRKMEAELEQKKKQEEEEKQREMELKAAEEKVESDPALLEVKERLDKLEKTVKEIAVDSTKQSADGISKSQQSDGKNLAVGAEAVDAKGTSESSLMGEQKPTEQTQGSDQDKSKVPSGSDSSAEDQNHKKQKAIG